MTESHPIGTGERLKMLEDALRPFARMRLSTEPQWSDCLHRSPASEIRRQADAIEARDAEIIRARAALSTLRKDEAE